MKKYKVFLSDNKVSVDRYMESTNEKMANECEKIETLLNSDYEMKDSQTAYGELHSISEVTNYNTEEKNLLTIFEKDINNVEFIRQENKDSYIYELSNQELKYVTDLRKVVIDNILYIVEEIYYDLSEEKIKAIIRMDKVV